MTRINANIDPLDLCDQHLLAEYREIVRIPNHVLKHKIDSSKIPDTFRLGTGHVKFFYNKIKFLHQRFSKLRSRLIEIGYECNITDSSFEQVKNSKPELYNDYDLNEGNSIVCDRIIERMSSMKKITIHKKSIDLDDYFKKLNHKYGSK